MTAKLPEDPSRFMEDMPSSNPLARVEGSVAPRRTANETDDTSYPDKAEPPTSPADPVDPQSPFADLDDDEQNDFDEDGVLDMEHMTRE